MSAVSSEPIIDNGAIAAEADADIKAAEKENEVPVDTSAVNPLKRSADDVAEKVTEPAKLPESDKTPSSDESASASAPPAVETKEAASRNVKPKKVQASLNFAVKVQLSSEQEKYLELEKRTMAADWYNAFLTEMRLPYFITIKKSLEKELASGKTVYPDLDEIYSFTRCPLKDVRVVILGQGLCFSVKKGVPNPPSLNNIFQELKNDLGDEFQKPTHGDLSGWCEQGVLLLNATLTVRAHEAASHASWGWGSFTDKIIAHFNRHCENVVFMLWGNHAQKKNSAIDKKRHLVLMAVHPSPLSAHRGFFGSKHFSKANKYLEEKGKKIVNWSALN
ncbi:hypothetical protein HDU97_002889 [Phlyctochytrium planicorne]|nr:hypothetical protein HDU97_002889 [Phlyctochytrium planicorne]